MRTVVLGQTKINAAQLRYAYRGSHPAMYMTSEGKAFKEAYQWEARAQWKGKPLTGDIEVSGIPCRRHHRGSANGPRSRRVKSRAMRPCADRLSADSMPRGRKRQVPQPRRHMAGAGFDEMRYPDLEKPMSSSITAPGPTGTLPGLG
jgi:hypothetical protein